MLELRGKYNTTKVFTDNVDNETISQVIELLNQDYIKESKMRKSESCLTAMQVLDASSVRQ